MGCAVIYLSNVTSLELYPEKCTGCGRCSEVCPRGVFIMNGKRAETTVKDLCMECGACMMNCAFGAIYVNAGVGCASALIGGMVSGSEPCCGEKDPDKGSGCC